MCVYMYIYIHIYAVVTVIVIVTDLFDLRLSSESTRHSQTLANHLSDLSYRRTFCAATVEVSRNIQEQNVCLRFLGGGEWYFSSKLKAFMYTLS